MVGKTNISGGVKQTGTFSATAGASGNTTCNISFTKPFSAVPDVYFRIGSFYLHPTSLTNVTVNGFSVVIRNFYTDGILTETITWDAYAK